MIRLSQLALARGARLLFEAADLTLHPGEKVGLVGPNGSGKSSLFALLRGELHADRGDAELPAGWRIAHVAQETPALDRPALDYAIDGDERLRRLEADLARAEADDDGTSIGELHAALDEAGAYTARSRAENLLHGLGFSHAEMALPVASFSGGWRMRLNLARALMCPSDLLLLDEPTNHLDLDAILWLEDWLKRYPGTLIVISHDRDFLDGIARVIVAIEGGRLRRYSGNYSDFERQRAAALVLAAAQIEKQKREREHLQSFIDRFRAKATKARQAQSRMKMLERMEDLAPLHAAAPFSFEFRDPLRAPDPLLVLEDVEAGYVAEPENKTVLSGVTLSLRSGQRYGILGINGAGKSTLVKTIAGELAPLGGSMTLGKGLAIGYFAQHQLETLRPEESPLWHLGRLAPEAREQDLRSFLGGFLFAGDMATLPTQGLSGGEKARLVLALLVWQRPNLLLLDEPTNHLDLETREALTVALAQFEGTLLLVSHDRHLLRATTEEFLIVSEGSVRAFDGDLEDYREWLFRTKLGTSEESSSVPAPSGAVERRDRKRREAEERQRLSAARKPLEARLRRLEDLMQRLQTRKKELETRLNDPALYEQPSPEMLKDLLAERATVARDLDSMEAEWLSLQEELDKLAA